MYHDYFGLRDAPFSIAPDPRYLYLTEQHREALAHLLYGVGDQGGFVVLTGEVGTGKTTVCRSLLQQMPTNADYAFVVNPRQSVSELLQTLCSELHIATDSDFSSKEYVDLLNEFLLENHARGRNTIVIIDEAQNLSVDVLEQLRLLTNLETNERKLLQLILLGQPELNDLLASHALRQLSQRVTARYHLRPLNISETESYILHRLQVAGCQLPLFTRAAVREIHKASGGIPRLINLISDRALLGVYAHNLPEVDRNVVRKACREVMGEIQSKPSRARVWLGVAAAILMLVAVGISSLTGSVDLGLNAATGTADQPAITTVVDNAAGADPETEAASTNQSPATPETWTFAQAFSGLATRWELSENYALEQANCPALPDSPLACMHVEAWAQAQHLNLPAVVELTPGQFGLVVRADTNVVWIEVGAGERKIAVEEVLDKPAWLLWRNVFAQTPPVSLQQHGELIRRALSGPEAQFETHATASTPPDRSDKTSMLYQHFVYLKPAPLSADEMRARLKQFQRDTGLQVTGKVDLATAARIGQRLHRNDPSLQTGRGS